jgi:serine/threonine-protein kinase SRPK3
MRNILLKLQLPRFNELTVGDLYGQVGPPSTTPVNRKDGVPVTPYAPAQAVYPMFVNMPANDVANPEIVISDYGTSFFVSQEKTPKLHTFPHYRPPEDFFGDPITLAADVWTLGVNLYEIMGERPLFEVFGWDSDDIIGGMVSTLGRLPERWWNKWPKRPEFFEADGSWAGDYRDLLIPLAVHCDSGFGRWAAGRHRRRAPGTLLEARCRRWRCSEAC